LATFRDILDKEDREYLMPAKLSSRNDLAFSVTVLRWLKGWEQEELAAAAGVSFSAVQAIEQGRRKQPSLRTLGPLAAALGVDLSTLAEVVSLIRRVGDRMKDPGAAQTSLPVGPAASGSVAAPALRREVMSLLLARLERGAGRAVADCETARRRAAALWELLEGCSEAGRWALIRELGDFHTAEFCELLCDQSLDAAGDSAERALRLAELAVEVAAKVAGPEGLRSRLLGYCGVHLASSLRVRGDDLPAAERASGQALRLWEAGAADDPGLFNAARMLHLQASLYRALRRLPEALALLDEALTIDRWGETPALLLGKARALAELGELEASIDLLRQAASLIDGERQPRQRFIAVAQLVWNLCHLGRHGDAELLLPGLEALAAKLGNRLDRLRADWLRGITAAGLGRTGEAISTLERVRAEFLVLENSYDAALVTLELAEVHAALGQTAEVKALARESAPVFADQGVHREAQRALELFRRAAEEERASPELVRPIVAYLYRARHDPRLRFEEAA
jgi:transcriptional regulator with XRE-family HTH domain